MFPVHRVAMVTITPGTHLYNIGTVVLCLLILFLLFIFQVELLHYIEMKIICYTMYNIEYSLKNYVLEYIDKTLNLFTSE